MAEKRILVTGAGGFIGGRLVEALHLGGAARPRAAIRRWASAPRIARFPVEIVLCDVTDRGQVEAAVAGCDAVVHCAVGEPEADLEGVRRLLDACARRGVGRFVFLSTVEVYGDAAGEVDEGSPCRPVNAYGRSKLAAEGLCREAGEAGLEVVVLRPAIVYGPYSRWWTERFADRLASGRWGLFKGYGEGPCNLLYVDDLVRAVLLSLERPAAGETFNVNGPDRVSWNHYVAALNAELGLPELPEIDPRALKLRAALLTPVRKIAELGLRHFGALVFGVYERFVTSRGLIRGVEGSLRTTPAIEELELYRRGAYYRTERAREVLGFEPRIDLAAGLERSCQWLRHHGFGR